MKLEENNLLRMTISDPEMVQKIRENGIESLTQDELNSFGIHVKKGQFSVGDVSQMDLSGSNRIRMRTYVGEKTGSSPLNRGIVRFIAAMFVVFVVLSVAGIIGCKMNPQISLTYEDAVFVSMFFAVGLGISLSAFHTASVAKKYLTERVWGICISQEYASGKIRSRRSIFEYTYKDKVYRSCESSFANKGYAAVGETRELMIAPENPRCIYDPIAGKARKFGGIKIGMIFIVITAVVVAVCIKG